MSKLAFAQIIENGVPPESFKVFPRAAKCEAWSQNVLGDKELVGKINLTVEMNENPMVVAESSTEQLNFKFGRTFAQGINKVDNETYCFYFYDSSNNDMKMLYFCNDYGEKSWMNNFYSAIKYSPSLKTFSHICKISSYGFRGRKSQCWDLKNCH